MLKKLKNEQGLLDAYSIPEYHCAKENMKDLILYVNSL